MAIRHKYQPTRAWMMHFRKNVYESATADLIDRDLWVANVDDLVYDPPYAFYNVSAVDPVTLYPTLTRIDPTIGIDNTVVDPDSLIAGNLRQYQAHISNRLFVDTSYSPARCTVDARYRSYIKEATHCKFFMGTNTSESGRVISQRVDINNSIVNEQVDMYNLWSGNSSIKVPETFSTIEHLEDGTKITMVIYGASGMALEERSFIVTLSQNIVGINRSNLYVENIELISPLLSASNTELLEVPAHTPLSTSLMKCRVHYSDGNWVDREIDGVKVKLHGLRSFNVDSPLVHNLVLSYYLDETEQAINAQGSVPQIPRTYQMKAVDTSTDQYGFRIWILPVYEGHQYRLEYYLTDMDYSFCIDVTNNVTVIQDNQQNFNPVAFGITQTLHLSVAMDIVLPGAYPGIVHTQITDITLYQPQFDGTDVWGIDYTTDGDSLFGGRALVRASLLNNKEFTLHAGYQSEYDWLTAFYGTLDPLYDTQVLLNVPDPTHFRIEHAGVLVGTFPVTDFYKTFELGANNNWINGQPVVVSWILKVNSAESIIAKAPFGINFN